MDRKAIGIETGIGILLACSLAAGTAGAQAVRNTPIGCGPAPAERTMLIGAWKLNLARSRAAELPRQEVRWYFEWGYGQSDHVETVHKDGTLSTSGYAACYDGKDYQRHTVSDGGAANSAGSVSLKRVDKYTVEAITKRNGFTQFSKLWVSKDGKTFTSEQTGFDAQGKAMDNVLVFDRIG
jgi:hypothetical protein